MNNKRQTVWLVSMLSLMVVLSAYYLFTGDAGKLDLASDTAHVQDIKVDSKEVVPDGTDAAGKTGQSTSADAKASDTKSTAKTDDKADPKSGAKSTDAKSADTKTSSTSKSADPQKQDAKAAEAGVTGLDGTDGQILKKLESQSKSGSDYIASMQLKRNEDLSKRTSQLLTIITDSKQNSDAVSKAYDEYYNLEQREAKITGIEEELQKDFINAILTEDGNKWKVLVQNDKLEKSQAVSIVDLVMKDLSVGPEMVSVQLLRN